MLRRLRRLLLPFLISNVPALAWSNSAEHPQPAAVHAALAITDVTVLPMDHEVVHAHQTVLVVGRSIAEIGPSTDVVVPEGATVIDGRDHFLMPGLSDMHAHVRHKRGQRPQDYLRQGITTVRNMAGEPSHLEFRAQVNSGALAGPTILTAGQPLTSGNMFPRHRRVETAEEGRAAVREQVAQGYDYIKVYSMLSREAFDGIVAEARAKSIPVVGHVTDQVPIRHALDSGISSIEHFFGYFWALESEDSKLKGKWAPRRLFHAVQIDPEKLGPIAAATAVAGVWNCPTLWRKSNYLTAPLAREAWETPGLRALGESNRRQLVKALHEAGAGLLAGSDDQAKILHEELALFVDSGLTPYDALRTATANVGEYLGMAGYGTITPKAPAHLVLLDANPLDAIENTRRIRGVVVNGTWIPRRGD